MLNTRLIAMVTTLVLAAAGGARAQLASGPDVIVGDITGPGNYGSFNNIAAFSLGTTSCNVGDQLLDWVSSTNQHPVIAQHLYRVKDGRLEMLGISWLKHGFAALQGSLCMPCQGGGSFQALGVGCSDPYGASLNGSQSNLGPRSEVNAATGFFPYPPQLNVPYSTNIDRRLQVHHDDLDPALNQGAVYIAEAQYVHPDDAGAGNDDNNASYRLAAVSPSGGSYDLSFTAPTVREKAAVEAWADLDSGVVVHAEDILGDGRMLLGFKATFLPSGDYRFVYALQNLNSDRSAGGFQVALPPGATASNLGFNDVDYHSGEPYSGTDWNGTVASNGVSWTVAQTHAQNPDANALRWGTTYTFWFESDQPAGDVTIDLFKPGTPSSVTIPALPIPQPAWQVNNTGASLDVDGAVNDPVQGPIQVEKISGTAGTINMATSAANSPFDIFVTAAPGVPDPAGTGPWDPVSHPLVNIDLAHPTLTPLHGYFQDTFPGSSASIPFVTPMATTLLSMQMAVIDPSSPQGYTLSALNEVDVHPAPRVVVEAVGSNSFNSTTASGFWRVIHNGNTPANITRVVLDYAGSAPNLATRYFDTDQTGMSGSFHQGSTYRNNSDVQAGLDYSVSSPWTSSGWIGTNPLSGSNTSFRTVDFRFTGGQFNGLTFEFDADTDGGPSSQGGASNAGLLVTVHLDDNSVLSGQLTADPNTPDRAFIDLQ